MVDKLVVWVGRRVGSCSSMSQFPETAAGRHDDLVCGRSATSDSLLITKPDSHDALPSATKNLQKFRARIQWRRRSRLLAAHSGPAMSICVHGLGYIGLATASLFANEGYDVTGYDVDESVTEQLRRGEPDISEPELEAYAQRALNDGLTVSNDPVPADYHLVCVPTPYDDDKESAVLSYVRQAGQTISEHLRRGDTVVLESTVPPGTTEGLFARELSQSGLVPGEEFRLGYTPETVLPGNTVTELKRNDRIVGGIDDESTAVISDLYQDVSAGDLHEGDDPTTAEFVKLAQNAARDVKIAYANTLALVAKDYNVDVRSAIDLANKHPRVDILSPGPGVGGHCLPVDPLFLGRWSDEIDLLKCARETNDGMPRYVVHIVEEALGTLENRTVAILGIAYKGGVGDTRNSPALEIVRQLRGETEHHLMADGAGFDTEIRLHDPHASDDVFRTVELNEAIGGADAVVFGAGHPKFAELDPARVGDAVANRVVVDPVDIIDEHDWHEHGFEVYGL